MNADGTNSIKLTEGRYPSWSPDGQKLVFSFGLERFHGDVTDICVIDADGENRVNLTHGRQKENMSPAWSPDGTKIAFASNRNGDLDIYLITSVGKNPKNLTLNLGFDTQPTWSPDGGKIAFGARNVDEKGRGISDIFVMNADGTNRVNLTRNPRAWNRNPCWSPDGKKIAFVALSNNVNTDIFVMNADGTQPIRLTQGAPISSFPSWSPDGTKIAFARATHERDDSYDIYVMNVDGSGLLNLTQTPGVSEWDTSWSPAPFSVSSQVKLPTKWGTIKN